MITAEQLEARRKWLGSSDIPALMGCNPWATPFDLWLDKTGQLEPKPATSAAIDLGNALESTLLKFASEQLHDNIIPDIHCAAEGLPIQTNIDGVTGHGNEPVEAKTAGLLSAFGAGDEWGEAGTDEVPPYVILQAHAHMLCMEDDPQRCHIPAFLGQRGMNMFVVQRNHDLIKMIIERAVDFWDNNVQKGIPPEKTYATGEVLARVIRIPRESIAVDPQLILAWRAAKEAEKSAKKEADRCRIVLLAALGNAEVGETPSDGDVTFLQQTRNSFDTKRLFEDHPDLKEIYRKETTHRVMRYRKPKEAQHD